MGLNFAGTQHIEIYSSSPEIQFSFLSGGGLTTYVLFFKEVILCMHVPFKSNSLFPFTTDFLERIVNMLNTIPCIHSSIKHNEVSESTIPLKLPWLLVNSENFLQIEKTSYTYEFNSTSSELLSLKYSTALVHQFHNTSLFWLIANFSLLSIYFGTVFL